MISSITTSIQSCTYGFAHQEPVVICHRAVEPFLHHTIRTYAFRPRIRGPKLYTLKFKKFTPREL